MNAHRWEDQTQGEITERLALLVEERDGSRDRVYEKYGSAGTSILPVVTALCEAARMDRPAEVLALLREFSK